MHGIYLSKDYKDYPWWLIPLLVGVILFCFGEWLHNIVLNGSDKTLATYTTAIQIDNEAEFNYSIVTRQGNIIAYVPIQATQPVKFPEMDKTFLVVDREKEQYTRHESTSCDSKGHCTTHVYYTWDEIRDDKIQSPRVKIYGKEYPTIEFSFGLQTLKASQVILGATKGDWYPYGGSVWPTAGDIRYSYQSVNTNVQGTVLANTSNGGLKPINTNKIKVSNKSIGGTIKHVQQNSKVEHIMFMVFWIILNVGLPVVVAYLIYNEIF